MSGKTLRTAGIQPPSRPSRRVAAAALRQVRKILIGMISARVARREDGHGVVALLGSDERVPGEARARAAWAGASPTAGGSADLFRIGIAVL